MDRDLMWPLYLACCTYLATLSLGASVQYAHVRLGRWRNGHHILFFSTWLTTGLAIALPTGLPLLPALTFVPHPAMARG